MTKCRQRCALALCAGLAIALGTAVAASDISSQKADPTKEQAKNVRIIIETEKGTIEAELYADKAPITVANFLRYVDGKFFDGGRFHRTVTQENQPKDKIKIEVIQAAINPSRNKEQFPAIKLERTKDTKIPHKDGSLSMARGGPDSAKSGFSICIGNQPEMDFDGKRNADGQGFAAFGQVTKGMDVVKKIQSSPAKAQNLDPAVKILKVERVKR